MCDGLLRPPHRGPEDGLIKVETCRPDNTLFLLYKKSSVVFLTDKLYLFGFSSFQRDYSTLKKEARRSTGTYEHFRTSAKDPLEVNCLIFIECSIHL